MVRWRHGDDRVVQEGHELQVHVGRHLRHDQQVVTAHREALDRLGMVDHHQLQADLRVQALECGEQVRRDVLGAGFNRQVELALQRALQIRELHVEAVQATEDVGTGAL